MNWALEIPPSTILTQGARQARGEGVSAVRFGAAGTPAEPCPCMGCNSSRWLEEMDTQDFTQADRLGDVA